jgi:hypothetical protein
MDIDNYTGVGLIMYWVAFVLFAPLVVCVGLFLLIKDHLFIRERRKYG